MRTIKDFLRDHNIKVPLTNEMMEYYLSLGCKVAYKYKDAHKRSYVHIGAIDHNSYTAVFKGNIRCLTRDEIKHFINRPEDHIRHFILLRGGNLNHFDYLYTDYEEMFKDLRP